MRRRPRCWPVFSPQAPQSCASTSSRRRSASEFPRSRARSWWSRAAHRRSQPRTVAQWGAASLTYRAAGFDYRVDHGAFFQVNRWLVDALVEQVTAGHKGELAWDLFAGVGLFARRLAGSFDRVVAVESAPAATAALAANLRGTTGAAVRCRDARLSSPQPQAGAAARPDRCGPAAHRAWRGDLRAARRDRRARAGLRFLRSGNAGARSARADRLRLRDRIHHAGRSVSADLSSGNGGAVAALLICIPPDTASAMGPPENSWDSVRAATARRQIHYLPRPAPSRPSRSS